MHVDILVFGFLHGVQVNLVDDVSGTTVGPETSTKLTCTPCKPPKPRYQHYWSSSFTALRYSVLVSYSPLCGDQPLLYSTSASMPTDLPVELHTVTLDERLQCTVHTTVHTVLTFLHCTILTNYSEREHYTLNTNHSFLLLFFRTRTL
jgi:hypothetical protein